MLIPANGRNLVVLENHFCDLRRPFLFPGASKVVTGQVDGRLQVVKRTVCPYPQVMKRRGGSDLFQLVNRRESDA